jgi:hypothetical protein
MKHDKGAGGLDGFPVRFSAACLKTGEEKIGLERRENAQLATSFP